MRDRWTVRGADLTALPLRYYVGGVGVVALAVLPMGLTAPQLASLTPVLFLIMFAMSWDFVSGYTGQISLGHTFFFALGGYGTTIFSLQHGLHPVFSICIGVVLAALGGIVIGIPALRVRGPFLALVTLIAPLVFLQFAILFDNELPYIAPNGLGGIAGFTTPNRAIAGIDQNALITTDSWAMAMIIEYYVVFAFLIAIGALLFAITRSQTGDVFTAIRENEDAVAAVGLNPAKYKIFAFVVSGAVGGLAGALFAHSSPGNPIQPEYILQLTLAIEIIVIAVFGGMGTIVGAAVGALFFASFGLLVDIIDFTIPLVGQPLSSFMPAPLFVIAALILMFRPQGLLPAAIQLGDRIQGRSPDRRPQREPPLKQFLDRLRKALRR